MLVFIYPPPPLIFKYQKEITKTNINRLQYINLKETRIITLIKIIVLTSIFHYMPNVIIFTFLLFYLSLFSKLATWWLGPFVLIWHSNIIVHFPSPNTVNQESKLNSPGGVQTGFISFSISYKSGKIQCQWSYIFTGLWMNAGLFASIW